MILIPTYPEKRVLYAKKGVISGSPRYNFPVCVDTSDHFCFLCSSCKRNAEVVCIEITEYNSFPEVYFMLHCSNCTTMATRKIWVGQH